jgi:hypothetical protein
MNDIFGLLPGAVVMPSKKKAECELICLLAIARHLGDRCAKEPE